ncbi:MAG: TlpA family protein disulfide reductase [Planctomycetes bacterium]|nr:TlpA family protein disulfide reductase [Planctomycetota bacterium]MCC7396949.1 TlpA family protein disulfide reductase [Planctomycetota bacterium]
MIPHERSLVEKWKDKPFVIIGVNSDGTDTAEGKKGFDEQRKEMGVTWRSFRNEGNTPSISDSWRVQGWPTLYFIDHDGVIRHKDLRDEEQMEKALEEMIHAAEEAGKAKDKKPAKPGK